jgi:stalled ribosome alternative rescue factor ArfA
MRTLLIRSFLKGAAKMPNVTLVVGDALFERIDREVERKRAGKGSGAVPKKELERAKQIAARDGIDAANRHLRKFRPPRVSRMGVVLEILDKHLPA